MKGATLFGLIKLGQNIGFEFLFFWFIGAVIIAAVVALGIAGLLLAAGKDNFGDNFKATFAVVGFIEFFMLLLTSC